MLNQPSQTGHLNCLQAAIITDGAQSSPERTPCLQLTAPAGTRKAISCASPTTSLSCTCRPTAPNSIPSRMSGPTCAATNSATASSKPTRISSMPAAMHGVGSCVERPGIQGRHCKNWRRHECGHVSVCEGPPPCKKKAPAPGSVSWCGRMSGPVWAALLPQAKMVSASGVPIGLARPWRSDTSGSSPLRRTGNRLADAPSLQSLCYFPVRPWLGRSRHGFAPDLASGHDRPDHSSGLVGQSDGRDLIGLAGLELTEPSSWFGPMYRRERA